MTKKINNGYITCNDNNQLFRIAENLITIGIALEENRANVLSGGILLDVKPDSTEGSYIVTLKSDLVVSIDMAEEPENSDG